MNTLQTVKIDVINSTRKLTYNEFNTMVLEAIENAGIPMYKHYTVNSLHSIRFSHDSIDFNSTVNTCMAGKLSYGIVLANPVYSGSETLHILIDTTV